MSPADRFFLAQQHEYAGFGLTEAKPKKRSRTPKLLHGRRSDVANDLKGFGSLPREKQGWADLESNNFVMNLGFPPSASFNAKDHGWQNTAK